MYHVMGGGTIEWFDTYEQAWEFVSRCQRPWKLYDPAGQKLAEWDGRI